MMEWSRWMGQRRGVISVERGDEKKRRRWWVSRVELAKETTTGTNSTNSEVCTRLGRGKNLWSKTQAKEVLLHANAFVLLD